MQMKKYVLVGGTLQLALTILAVYALLIYFGQPVGTAILIGFLVSVSSTAIVLRIIQKNPRCTPPRAGPSWAFSSSRISL